MGVRHRSTKRLVEEAVELLAELHRRDAIRVVPDMTKGATFVGADTSYIRGDDYSISIVVDLIDPVFEEPVRPQPVLSATDELQFMKMTGQMLKRRT